MASSTVTVELPSQLYADLQALAQQEQVDMVTLLEHLLATRQTQPTPPAAPSPTLQAILARATDLGVSDLAAFNRDPNMLSGLNRSALLALAEGVLAPVRQEWVAALLDHTNQGALADAEESDLDALVEQIGQLNPIEARAQYALHKLEKAAH